jgi:uncharacterized protein DUF6152
MKKLALFLVVTFAVLLISRPILAHHGEANYDTDNLVSVKATVTSFLFINPHVQVTLERTNDKGEVEKWTCEARSPAMLVRSGDWDKNTLKVGDVITAIGFQSRNGAKILRLKKIVLSNGKELPDL